MKHSKLKEMVLVTTLREKSMKRKCQLTKENNWTHVNQLHDDINAKSKALFKGSLNPCKGNGQYLKSSKKGQSVMYVLLEGNEQVFDLLGENVKIAIKLINHNGAKGLAKLKGHGWVV